MIDTIERTPVYDGRDTVGDFHDEIKVLLCSAKSALKKEKGAKFKELMLTPLQSTALDVCIRDNLAKMSKVVDATKSAHSTAAYAEAVRLETRIEAEIIPATRFKYHPVQKYFAMGQRNFHIQQNNYYDYPPNNRHNEAIGGQGKEYVGYIDEQPMYPLAENTSKNSKIYHVNDQEQQILYMPQKPYFKNPNTYKYFKGDLQ